MMPISLDEAKGQAPIFYSEKVVVRSGDQSRLPFFFRKEDLDAAWRELQGTSKPDVGAEGGDARARRRAKAEAQATGLPSGLIRIATLDGVIKQMQSGEVDLRNALFVGSPEAVVLSKQLLAEQAASGATASK